MSSLEVSLNPWALGLLVRDGPKAGLLEQVILGSMVSISVSGCRRVTHYVVPGGLAIGAGGVGRG